MTVSIDGAESIVVAQCSNSKLSITYDKIDLVYQNTLTRRVAIEDGSDVVVVGMDTIT